MDKEPKQLKPIRNKWIVFFILLLTVAATLFFYFSGGGKLEMGSPNFGAPKIYQF